MSSTNSGYLLSASTSLLLLIDNPSRLVLAGVVLYLTPATSALGAVLLTACLGGITAVHSGASQLPRDALFSIYVGVLMWTGLLERDARLRAAVFRWSASP